MKNLIENNLVRFVKIRKTKESLFADFKVKGVRGGTTYTASISVDIAEAELDPSETLETIIEGCAKVAVREFTRSDMQFEGLQAI